MGLTPVVPGYGCSKAGCDPECFEPNPVPPLSGPTIEITHTGEIYAIRSPGPFLDAVQQRDAAVLVGRALRVRFIGGFQLEEKKKETEDRVRRGLDGLVFLKGHVPYNQSIRAMVRADLLLLLDTPGQRAGVPAKLYEYVGAGRSILALAALDSDVAWVLRESGVAHRVAAPLDAEAIRRALTELLQDPAIARRSGLQFPIQTRFTRERHGCELVAVLDSGRGALPSTDGEPIRAKPSSPERTLDLPFRHES